MFKHLARLRQSAATLSNVAIHHQHQVGAARAAFIRNAVHAPQFNLFGVKNLATFSTASTRKATAATIPDYEVDEISHHDLKRLVLTPEEVNKKHPTEYAVGQMRDRLNYLNQISETELMLFNLPESITKEKIIELCSVKGVQVINAALTPSLNENKRAAFGYVKVGTPAQVKILKERFRNVWIEDRKVKLKARDDLQYEVYDHRTVIVRNLPNHYQKKQLVQIFQHYGAVVGLEVPIKNIAIEEELKEKVNQYEVKRKQQGELVVKRAQKLVKDSIRENVDYYNAIFSKYLGPEEASQMILQLTDTAESAEGSADTQATSLLNEKRHVSIQQMIHQLQAENVQVGKAKNTLIKLRDHVDSSIPSLDASVSTRDLTSQLDSNKGLLSNTISYLRQNRENLDELTLAKLNSQLNPSGNADPIAQLQSLSRTELAYAYDTLIQCLNQREGLIEKRIKDQVQHLGKEERVIFEDKDWSRETEDIKKFDDPFGDVDLKAEEILSVNEQVRNIVDFKDVTPQQRLYEMVTRRFNPFLTPNFNVNQLAASEGDMMSTLKIPRKAIDPNQAPSVARASFAGYKFLDENLDVLQAHVESLKDKFDIPFDELYHKEKRLVDAVIKATQALQAKEALLPNPMGDERTFSLDELKGQYLGEEFQPDHPFIRAQRKRNEKLLNESLDSEGSSAFSFSLDDTKSKIHELLDQGLLTKKDYDQLILMERQANEVNLGYAFVTFSHSDEAKLALILGQGIFLDGIEAVMTLKTASVDHKDFDVRYNINKQRNEAQVVKELQTLREARKELRQFEQDIDRELPSLKKLKEFRELARDVIDNGDKPKYQTFNPKRTQEEEDILNDKIRKLQKENPDIDYTQLFDTERAEQARKTQHKKAFASYKAFQFLKNGVDVQAKKVSSTASGPIDVDTFKKKTPPSYQSADPYDFPPLQDAVKALMRGSSDGLPRVLDAGDQLESRPGRKFGYTEQDFLEAYFGKDNARAARVTLDDETSIFGFNDSYKRKYPIDKYQRLPELEAKQRLMQERQIFSLDSSTNEDAQQEQFNNFIKSIDQERGQGVKDKAHPTDKNRSLLKDIESRMENYTKRKERVTGQNVVNSREVGYIRSKLKEEYFPKPKKEAVPAAAADAKLEEKFEPFYEGEGAASNDAPATDSTPTPDSTTTTTSQTGSTYKPRKDFKKGGGGGQYKQNRSDRYESGPVQKKEAKTPEWQKNLNFKGLEADEFNLETEASADVKELNKDFLYDQKFRTDKRPFNPDIEFDSVEIKRLKQFAEANNMNPNELFEKLKNTGSLTGKDAVYGGLFTDKEKFGLNKTDADVRSRERRHKSIEDFAGTKQPATSPDDADLSEREDEDIYTHYIEQMRRAKLEQAQEKPADKDLRNNQRLTEETLRDLEGGIYQDLPRFEGFFRSQSKGKHPLEEDSYQYQERTTAEDIRAEEKIDEELLQRELEGRLMGEKLTPRQFELLYKARVEGGGEIKYIKDNDSNIFLDSRDMVRIMEEQRESTRRRMVQHGKWTEADSQRLMQEAVEEAGREAPTDFDEKKIKREFRNLHDLLSRVQNPQKLYEKEYYFDEGLGQSLKDHVDELKTTFADLQVLVRRDRDGYPIVKTQYKPKYKYNLEDLESIDIDRDMTAVKETLDDYLQTILGQKGLQSLDKEQIEAKLALMTQNKNGGEERYDFDDKTKGAIKYLWNERVKGRFQNDREGFTKAFLELSESAAYDTTKPLGKITPFTTNEVDSNKIYSQLIEERELITYELSEQLALRVKEHIFLKERKESDFVRPRRSETSIFDDQVQSNETRSSFLERQAAEIDSGRKKDEGSFDKEAYQEIKAEIKRRREAKERLLKQGFPELKSYVTI